MQAYERERERERESNVLSSSFSISEYVVLDTVIVSCELSMCCIMMYYNERVVLYLARLVGLIFIYIAE